MTGRGGRGCRTPLLHAHPGRLDDRAPARDLAHDKRMQRRWAALRFLGDVAAEQGEPPARVLVVERLLERVGELIDDRLWRALRGEDAVPARDQIGRAS